MFATNLRFAFDLSTTPIRSGDFDAIQPGPRFYMIDDGATFLESFEISDLTIDCNLENAPFDKDRITTAPAKGKVVTPSGGATGTKVETENGFLFFEESMIGKAIILEGVPDPDGKVISVGSTIKSLGPLTNGKASEVIIDPPMTADGQYYYFGITGMRCGVTAASLTGNNIRIRRVRVINFGVRAPGGYDGGSQSSYLEGLNSSQTAMQLTAEGFPLRINGRNGAGGAERPSFNSWYEDCVFEQP